jgi:hypothetical protein
MTVGNHIAGDGGVRHAMPWIVRWWWVWSVLAFVSGVFTIAAAEGFPILDLELAWTVERADEVTREADLDAIRSAVLWDFAFICFYALALSTGALWARRQFRRRSAAAMGTGIAIGGVAAGLFDIVENLSMLGYLEGWGGWGGWIGLAGTMAIPKFLLAAAGVVYIAAGVMLFVVRRHTN